MEVNELETRYGEDTTLEQSNSDDSDSGTDGEYSGPTA